MILVAFGTAFIFVVLAEMGDKTQLLAMACETKYRWQTVMCGVFVATVFNHLLAVLVGNYITNFIPMNYIQIGAAVSFILFGLWTIRGDELDEDDKVSRYGPFITVALAFFLAEMGDKTQLATIALAAKFQAVLPVWLGTTSGMMVADGLGIILGIVLGKKIPERVVKWGAALIFIAFGMWGLYENLPSTVLTLPIIIAGILVLLLSMYFIARFSKKAKLPDDQ